MKSVVKGWEQEFETLYVKQFQVDFFVVDAAPHPLDEYVVAPLAEHLAIEYRHGDHGVDH